MKRGVACWLVALMLLGSPAARAGVAPVVRGQAKVHLDRGLALYQSRQFAAAAAEFEATYVREPHRDVLYVWAQALRLAGQCAPALELYQRFLATAPPRREAERARVNQARCHARAAPAAPSSPVEPAPPELHSAAAGVATASVAAGDVAPPLPPSRPGLVVDLSVRPTEPGPAVPAPRSRGLDRADLIVLGGGVVAAAVGGAFYLSARSEHSAARGAISYSAVQQHADTARTRERIAWGALAVGSTLLIAGVLRYVLR